MPRDEAFWNSLYAAFDPTETLAGERGSRLYTEREDSPFDEMRQILWPTMPHARPPVAYLSGHRGSGKSSLLVRLLEHCGSELFVVYFDVQHNLDTPRANQIDVLYLLGAAIYTAALSAGFEPDETNLKELSRSVYSITHTEHEKPVEESLDVAGLAKNLVVFTAGMLGSEAGRKLAEAALAPFKIRLTSEVSEEVARKREIEPQVQQVINNVNLIIADVQDRTKKPLLAVVDGLDKLDRIAQARLIFLESRALMGPVCRLIYTVPMLIQTTPEFMEATQEAKRFFLPNVRTFEKLACTRHEGGYRTLTEVAQRRLAEVGITPVELFEDGVLDYLIGKSGGVMRWYIALVLSSCQAAERKGLERVSMPAAQHAVSRFVQDLTGKLTTERLKELQRVHEDKLPSGNAESNELMHALFIVAYQNGDTWYDAHPMLWDRLTK